MNLDPRILAISSTRAQELFLNPLRPQDITEVRLTQCPVCRKDGKVYFRCRDEWVYAAQLCSVKEGQLLIEELRRKQIIPEPLLDNLHAKVLTATYLAVDTPADRYEEREDGPLVHWFQTHQYARIAVILTLAGTIHTAAAIHRRLPEGLQQRLQKMVRPAA